MRKNGSIFFITNLKAIESKVFIKKFLKEKLQCKTIHQAKKQIHSFKKQVTSMDAKIKHLIKNLEEALEDLQYDKN